jgi:hypothetical protein
MGGRRFFDGAQEEIGSLPIVSSNSRFWIKINGVWKKTRVYLKINGVWRQVVAHFKNSGMWR